MAEKQSFAVGGQALLEGVMFKGQDKIAMAVRKPSGSIHVESHKINSLANRNKIFTLPIIRGAFNLVDAMKLGVEMLTLSANISEGEQGEEIGKKELFFAVTFAVAAAIGLFFVAPTLIVEFIQWVLSTEVIFRNLLEGFIRLMIFLGYVVIISKLKEIFRVFQYHGAEHMVVHCFENNEELTVKNVSKCSPLHKRCGTSFLLLVMVISVVVFSLIPWMSLIPRILLRIAVVPLIAGIAFEVTRLAGRSQSLLIKVLMYPGLMLQKLTTRQPDEGQIEVAIAALNAVLGNNLTCEIDTDNGYIYNENEIACKEEV